MFDLSFLSPLYPPSAIVCLPLCGDAAVDRHRAVSSTLRIDGRKELPCLLSHSYPTFYSPYCPRPTHSLAPSVTLSIDSPRLPHFLFSLALSEPSTPPFPIPSVRAAIPARFRRTSQVRPASHAAPSVLASALAAPVRARQSGRRDRSDVATLSSGLPASWVFAWAPPIPPFPPPPPPPDLPPPSRSAAPDRHLLPGLAVPASSRVPALTNHAQSSDRVYLLARRLAPCPWPSLALQEPPLHLFLPHISSFTILCRVFHKLLLPSASAHSSH